jgi:hypothetical protein
MASPSVHASLFSGMVVHGAWTRLYDSRVDRCRVPLGWTVERGWNHIRFSCISVRCARDPTLIPSSCLRSLVKGCRDPRRALAGKPTPELAVQTYHPRNRSADWSPMCCAWALRSDLLVVELVSDRLRRPNHQPDVENRHRSCDCHRTRSTDNIYQLLSE